MTRRVMRVQLGCFQPETTQRLVLARLLCRVQPVKGTAKGQQVQMTRRAVLVLLDCFQLHVSRREGLQLLRRSHPGLTPVGLTPSVSPRQPRRVLARPLCRVQLVKGTVRAQQVQMTRHAVLVLLECFHRPIILLAALPRQ